ncbi:beta-galactosidase trimerization domain-containing protein [Marinivivus vitaminiproducens]|uniref:beta-galactosidase trimerization domain-containing protein n=1 Tax=Marinivivus vitaminiproducens TaxID=3035935 RepID=UPI0027AADCCD|nr:beta-galactosidase trimerization domain-containing protein [Geminicoccaceae bacterium SCSIO 64248]
MPPETETIDRPTTPLADPPWWRQPYRMVQTNLRQTDAALDPRRVARQAREFGANVLLFNIGGIFAFYPTDLALHARNPFLTGDLLGDMLKAAHDEGLKLVGRFDLSKATRIAYEAHPDWFVHNREGRPIRYNGTYQACVNGGWYQDYAHRIVREALGRYPVDGVFFNMFGYRNSDYSGNYHGICVCRRCRERFRALYGRDLPEREDFSDPAYRDYLAFQQATTAELAADIYATIKDVNPAIAMTGHRHSSDLIRMEVQRAVDRPAPEWPYQAGEQARWAAAIGRGKTFSSTSTNFIDYAWRFSSETGAYHMLRFAQQLAGGASLDYYLLGTFDQDDTKPFEHIRRLYAWHGAHEDYYRDLRPAARIGLYESHKTAVHARATKTGSVARACFKGAYRALVESRLPFDFIADQHADAADFDALLARYDVIVLPNVACLDDAEAAALDAYVAQGGVLLATGETGAYDAQGNERDALALACLPVERIALLRDGMRGAYFQLDPDWIDLPDTSLLYLDGWYVQATPREGARAVHRLLPPQRFGPPELCFPEVEASGAGALVQAHGKGQAIYLPWLPEWLYDRDSLPDHRVLLTSLIRRHAPPQDVRLEGAGPVEITVHDQPGHGRRIVHLVNFSGQRNNLYEEPVAIHGLRLGVRKPGGQASALVAGTRLDPSEQAADHEGFVWFDLPPLAYFEAIVLPNEP